MSPPEENKNESTQYHPIDHAFFRGYENVKEEALSWAIYWFRDKEKRTSNCVRVETRKLT